MIGLFADAVVAFLRVASRSLKRASPADSPPAVEDAQPAGAGFARQPSGTGGHPRPTSQLLMDAAIWVGVDFPEAGDFVCELEDRAKKLASVGD